MARKKKDKKSRSSTKRVAPLINNKNQINITVNPQQRRRTTTAVPPIRTNFIGGGSHINNTNMLPHNHAPTPLELIQSGNQSYTQEIMFRNLEKEMNAMKLSMKSTNHSTIDETHKVIKEMIDREVSANLEPYDSVTHPFSQGASTSYKPSDVDTANRQLNRILELEQDIVNETNEKRKTKLRNAKNLKIRMLGDYVLSKRNDTQLYNLLATDPKTPNIYQSILARLDAIMNTVNGQYPLHSFSLG